MIPVRSQVDKLVLWFQERCIMTAGAVVWPQPFSASSGAVTIMWPELPEGQEVNSNELHTRL